MPNMAKRMSTLPMTCRSIGSIRRKSLPFVEPARSTQVSVCKSGGRNQKACEKMLAAGAKNMISGEGGTAECEAAGMPVARGQKVMSLERRVRIAAGSPVASGAALAAFGPGPLWQQIGMGLAGFIGSGLVLAGLTDTYRMGMLIAKMPWIRSVRSAVGQGGSCSQTN